MEGSAAPWQTIIDWQTIRYASPCMITAANSVDWVKNNASSLLYVLIVLKKENMKFFKFFTVCFSVGCLISIAWAQEGERSPTADNTISASRIYTNNPIVATLEGEVIHLQDVTNKSIHDLLRQLHEALQDELPRYILKKLAKTHSEFGENYQIEISNDQIQRFYEQNQLKKRGSLEQFAPQIKQFLTQQIEFKYKLQQFNSALKQGLVISYLEPPLEFLVTAAVGSAMIRSSPEASVMLLEYSDYQCPFCARSQATISQLIKKYEGKVTFAYRHFPLSFHTEADEAANAAECAREQGKFEEIHAILFAHPRQQFPENLKAYGKQINIRDLKKFEQCVDEEKYRELVQNDIEEGFSIGISGTPGFVIGSYDANAQQVMGEILSGSLPLEQFEKVIEKYLQKKS